ncbi:MAG: hypothetical protein ACYTFI_03815 [Planctomycetota bacterium]
MLLALVLGPAMLPPRAAVARGVSNVLSRERRVSGGRAFSRDDPVPALAGGDVDLFKGGLSQPEITKLLDGYLDRMLAFYAEKHRFPETLVPFLGNRRNKVAKEVFVSALDPRYDDIGAAARVFEELRALDEKKLVKYVHLATALAVVYDTPNAVEESQEYCIYAVEKSQFHGLPKYRDVWQYYTAPRLTRRFGFSLDRLPWCILVHLVDNDANDEDRRWSLAAYNAGTNVARLYPRVPYDHEKMNMRPPKLGKRPYKLSNLLKYGGVCGDQAHFASRVAKCLGVPAMKVSGSGRYGGSGHAWTGYLVIQKGRPTLEFTGRFFYDYYYTGNIFDPQTRTATLDRYIAMMYDGASLSYPKYNKSQMLVRIAEKIRAEHAAESLELTRKALELNYFNMWGWPLLMEHIKDGTLSKKLGLSWFNKMTRALRGHPDMTFVCLNTFIGCVPEANVRGRQSLYNQAASLYASRPDLLLKLRVAQAKELAGAGEKAQAVNLLVPTIVRHAKEAKLVLPAMRMAVELARELRIGRQVRAKLRAAEKTFPKDRAGTPSVAYEEFKKLLDELK